MTTPSSGEEARRIARLVVDLLHTTTAARREESVAAVGPSGAGGERHTTPHGGGGDRPPVSPQAVRAAVLVYELEETTVGGIATGLGISAGWASRLVEELEERGYVVRERDEADRRVVHVRLSPDAVEEVSRVYRWRDEPVERALAGLDADGREAVARFLAALVGELAAEADAGAR